MALPPLSNEAKSQRPAGQLPNVLRPFEDAQTAVEKLSPQMQSMIGPIVDAIHEATRQQNRLNAMLWARTNSLPGRHGSTHRDGLDNIASNSDPTAITIAAVADPGTPHHGFSRDDHVHPLGDDIADILDILDGLEADPIWGIPVDDSRVRKLLEKILLELYALNAHIDDLLNEGEAVIQTFAGPPVSIASTTSPVVLLQPNVDRVGFVIVNDGTQNLFVKYGTNPTTTDWTYKVTTGSTLELPTFSGYQGVVSGVWDTANGQARVTEMVRLRTQ